MIKEFISSNLLWIKLGAIALVVGYLIMLNLQVSHYKTKADDLRIEVKNWKFTYKTLADAANKQNEAIKSMQDTTVSLREAVSGALKAASLSTSIRQPKINAATARLNSLIKSDCVTEIENAKKELRP
jgi:predicted negative regulator of RcsB-dependent stress response